MITFEKEIRVVETYELVIDNKVIDYLFNRIKAAEKDYHYPEGRHFVLKTGHNKYVEITKDVLRNYLKDGNMYSNDFRVLHDNLEEYGTIFEVEHASPWDHRWPGDYDKDAYDDWKEAGYCLEEIYNIEDYERDYFETHKDEFNWNLIKTKKF